MAGTRQPALLWLSRDAEPRGNQEEERSAGAQLDPASWLTGGPAPRGALRGPAAGEATPAPGARPQASRPALAPLSKVPVGSPAPWRSREGAARRPGERGASGRWRGPRGHTLSLPEARPGRLRPVELVPSSERVPLPSSGPAAPSGREAPGTLGGSGASQRGANPTRPAPRRAHFESAASRGRAASAEPGLRPRGGRAPWPQRAPAVLRPGEGGPGPEGLVTRCPGLGKTNTARPHFPFESKSQLVARKLH